LEWIGLWREHVAPFGVERVAEMVRAAGLKVSTLCRGGFFPSDTERGWKANVDENLRVLDEAATLGTDTVVLVCGGIAGGDLDRSRRQVATGIEAIVPRAQDLGVRLAIEPLHPMYCADRSVIVTLRQALDLAEEFPADVVGVTVDTFHLWWDPEVWDHGRRGDRLPPLHRRRDRRRLRRPHRSGDLQPRRVEYPRGSGAGDDDRPVPPARRLTSVLGEAGEFEYQSHAVGGQFGVGE